MTTKSTNVWDIVAEFIDPEDLRWDPQPHQIPPAGKWYAWLMLAGRGAGKTHTASKYVHDIVYGPPMIKGVPGGHWISIVGPTLGDAVTSCVNGPSGLRRWDPGIKVIQQAGGTICRWSNGVEGKLFGAHTPEDVERFRAGGNRSLVWCEELAAWRYMEESWQQIRYGLRTGMWPHAIITTTPKPRKLIREMVKKAKEAQARGDINPEYVMTQATTRDNPYLDQRVKAMLYEDYEGTRLGRQELFGEVLEDVEGALWSDTMIERNRFGLDEYPTHLDYTVVAVDPQAKEGSTETGIVVFGFMRNYSQSDQRSHGFVLADLSIDGSPNEWGNAVVNAYYDYNADIVVGERNNGGDMVRHVIESIDDSVPYRDVVATKGKGRRAEPVANLYEQNRVHHIGMFAKLEDQMCFPAGTAIDTQHGQKPIETVQPGELVWTRQGLKPVDWSGITGFTNDLVTVLHVHGALRCTPWHPIWTQECGFVPAKNVQPGHHLLVSTAAVSTVPLLRGVVDGGGETAADITATVSILNGRYIEQFGLPTTDLSQQGTWFTTRTRIPVTTAHPIYNSSAEASTRRSTGHTGRLAGLLTRDHRAARKSGSLSNHVRSSVLGANPLLNRRGGQQYSAVVSVTATASKRVIPVYDLEIQDLVAKEFIANGILVHNTTFNPLEELPDSDSPDRMDALVWGATETMIAHSQIQRRDLQDTRLRGTR